MASLKSIRFQLHPVRKCRQNSRAACGDSCTRCTVSSRGALFHNAVSASVSRWIERSQTVAVPADRQRLLGTPACLFGGFFGRDQAKESPTRSSKFQYHACSPPFPAALLGETFLAGKEVRCCYKASVDGFSAIQFHERCDFKGPCVIVGTTDKGFRFGAFSPEGYRSTDDYYDTFDAFLFYWPLSEPESDSSPIVLKKVGGSGAALFDYARGGPQFGADGLLIGPPLAPVMGGFAGPDTNSGVGQLSDARSRLGLSYAKRPDGKDSLFGDDRKASLVEIEVFCSPAIADLY